MLEAVETIISHYEEEMSFFWLDGGVEQVMELLRITLHDLDHWSLYLHATLPSMYT